MKRFIKSSYFALIMLFVYVPIFVMILFSFNNDTSLFSWQGFTWKWYGELAKNSPLIKSLIVSLFVALISTVISIVIGVMACVGLAKVKRRARNNWTRVANIPLVNADVITAIGLMIFFVLAGIKFGTITLVAAHVSFNVPYVIVTVLPFMMRIDPNMIQASRDLGGTSRQTFYRVILPTLLPSIITATGICFAMSFDDFIISYFTGGSQTNVSTFIYTQKKLKPFINAFGTLLVLAIVVVFLLWNGVSITRQQLAETKLKIKKNEYKIKQIGRINSQIAYLKKCLETETIILKSHSLFKWLKLKTLQGKVKRLENKNTDIKISRLEWKKELINQEIKQEARYFTIFKKLTEKRAQFEAKLSNAVGDKKTKKYEQIVQKLDKRIAKYQSEIDWINERNLADKAKVIELEEQIATLQAEMTNVDSSNSKELLWYKKRIAKLTTLKNNLALGSNNAKMQAAITKLAEFKKNLAAKLVSNYEQLQKAKAAIYQIVPFAYKAEAKLQKAISTGATSQQEILAQKVNEHLHQKNLVEARLTKEEEKLAKLTAEIAAKKAKYFPEASDDDNVEGNIRTKNWFMKNWKKLGMGTLLTGSFALITTAYALNNRYDLVIGNWGNYIDMSLIDDFEKEYGVKVNYQQYDSNESLYNKNYTFNYDVMVPSDYMVKKLAQEGFLAKLDFDELNREVEGHETIRIVPYAATEPETPVWDEEGAPDRVNISENFENALRAISVTDADGTEGDLTDYALPWIFGDVRIVFNKDNQKLVDWLTEKGLISDETSVEGLDVSKLSWNILWEAAEKGFNLALNNDPKNVFMYAFEKVYGNVQISSAKNAREEIDTAAETLKSLLQRRNVGLYGDELIDVAHERSFDIAVMYNGDIIYSLGDSYEAEDEEADALMKATPLAEEEVATDPNIFVGIPGAPVANQPVGEEKYETTNIFSDNIAISKSARNKNLVYRFINFMYRWDSQWKILDETGATPGFQETVDSIVKDEYFGEHLTNLIQVTDRGDLFDLNTTWDNYLVDKFNEIIAMKQ